MLTQQQIKMYQGMSFEDMCDTIDNLNDEIKDLNETIKRLESQLDESD